MASVYDSFGSYPSYHSYHSYVPPSIPPSMPPSIPPLSDGYIGFTVGYSVVAFFLLFRSLTYIAHYMHRIRSIAREYIVRLHALPLLVLVCAILAATLPRANFAWLTTLAAVWYAWYALTLACLHIELVGAGDFPTTATTVSRHGTRVRILYTAVLLRHVAISVVVAVGVTVLSLIFTPFLDLAGRGVAVLDLFATCALVAAACAFVALSRLLRMAHAHRPAATPPAVHVLFYMAATMCAYDLLLSIAQLHTDSRRTGWWVSRVHVPLHVLYVFISYVFWERAAAACMPTALLADGTSTPVPTRNVAVCDTLRKALQPLRSATQYRMYRTTLFERPHSTSAADLQAEYNAL